MVAQVAQELKTVTDMICLTKKQGYHLHEKRNAKEEEEESKECKNVLSEPGFTN